MKLYLAYREVKENVPSQYDDPGEYGWSEERVHFTPLSLVSSPTKYPELSEQIEVPEGFSAGFVVIVRYEDGCTFGRTYGLWEFIGVYSSLQEATEIEDSIRKGTYYQTYINHRGVTEKVINSWNTYFASLEDVEIHYMKVEEAQ